MRILFFSPHSLPWKHAFPEAIIADYLKNSGNEIIYLTCGGALGDYCIPKFSAIPEDKRDKKNKKNCKAICVDCKNTDKYLRNNFNLKGPTFQNTLTQENINEVERIISNLDIKKVFRLKYFGINIGKIAFYQIILRYKIINPLVSSDLKERYLSDLRDTFYSAFVIQKVIKSKKIDAILLYNSMYSVNKIVTEVAKIHGIDTYFIHAGSNLSERLRSLMISKNDVYTFYSNLIKNWPKFSENTYTLSEYKKVTRHIKELLHAKSIFTYSIKKSSNFNNVKRIFSVPESSKILVATMASYDEEIAAEFIGTKQIFNNEIFSSQIDWIKSLISYAEKNQNLFLIIRPHPREFPNRRDSRISEHAKQILELAKSDLPQNVRFNLPEDKISLYDFIDEADVFLNSWSNVGKEIAIFGVPVVIYSKNNLYYHTDLNYIGLSKNDYFKKIEEAIINGWNFKFVVKVFKWYVYEQQSACISLHSVCNLKEANNKNLIILIIEKILNCFSPLFVYSFDVFYYKKGQFKYDLLNKLIMSKKTTLIDIIEPAKTIENNVEIDFLKIEFLNLLKLLYPRKSDLIKSKIYNKFIRL